MDAGYERLQRLQAVGMELAKAYRDAGYEAWRRVATCNGGITLRGGVWRPSGRCCHDRFCPCCSYASMLRYIPALEVAKKNELFFCTYTWRQGLETELIYENLCERNRLIRYFSGKDVIWKAEFTLRSDGTLHHHIHSVQMNPSNCIGFKAPWQDVDITPFDGNFKELIKYLAKEESFSYISKVALALQGRRVRMRGKRGFSVERPHYDEWPVVVTDKIQFGRNEWQEDVGVTEEVLVDAVDLD